MKKILAIVPTTYTMEGTVYEGITVHILEVDRNRVSSYFVRNDKLDTLGLTEEMTPPTIDDLPEVNAYFEAGFNNKLKLVKVELVS